MSEYDPICPGAQKREAGSLALYDAIVVGAGFSGAVAARQLAEAGYKVTVLEQRNHIGGNCYDYKHSNGVMVHRYGPHLFHTSNQVVWDYLSRFTEWMPYQHRVLASIDGRLAPVPFNLNSLDVWFEPPRAQKLAELLLQRYGADAEVPITELMQAKEPLLEELADFIYHKMFLNYTVKQWGVSPEKIDQAVLARVPVRVSRDDRYFLDRFQAIPAAGYSTLIGRILEHPGIEVVTDLNALSLLTVDTESGGVLLAEKPYAGAVIYTGMIDELLDFRFGELDYRSLQFVFEDHAVEYLQPVATVNYPNDPAMTRITEFRHLCDSTACQGTTIVKEFPQDYDRTEAAQNIPYYPLFTQENSQRYRRYLELVERIPGLFAIGRLAEFRYYDMDDAVANALQQSREVIDWLQGYLAQATGRVHAT